MGLRCEPGGRGETWRGNATRGGSDPQAGALPGKGPSQAAEGTEPLTWGPRLQPRKAGRVLHQAPAGPCPKWPTRWNVDCALWLLLLIPAANTLIPATLFYPLFGFSAVSDPVGRRGSASCDPGAICRFPPFLPIQNSVCCFQNPNRGLAFSVPGGEGVSIPGKM